VALLPVAVIDPMAVRMWAVPVSPQEHFSWSRPLACRYLERQARVSLLNCRQVFLPVVVLSVVPRFVGHRTVVQVRAALPTVDPPCLQILTVR
jgi:hypothetical protein